MIDSLPVHLPQRSESGTRPVRSAARTTGIGLSGLSGLFGLFGAQPTLLGLHQTHQTDQI